MEQAASMQSNMQKTQAELEAKTVTAESGGGKVKVTANGAGDVLSVTIDPSIIDPSDADFLNDLVTKAVQEAIAKGKQMAQSEMSKLTGGLNIPGLS